MQDGDEESEREVELKSFSKTRVGTPLRRRAYALLNYGDDRAMQCATMAAALACRRVSDRSEYDVVLIRVGAPLAGDLIPDGVIQKPVPAPATRGRYQWSNTFAKFYVATELFSEYASVVFVDADVLIRRPLLPLFEAAESLPGTLVAPRAYWLKQPFAVSGTFALSRQGNVSHVHDSMKRVLERRGEQWDGDMDWFNSDRALVDEMSLLSGFFTLLVGEFAPGDPAYRYWSNHFGWSPEEVYDNAYLVHFVAGWKPWRSGIREAKGNETEELRRVFRDWKALRDETGCTEPSHRRERREK